MAQNLSKTDKPADAVGQIIQASAPALISAYRQHQWSLVPDAQLLAARKQLTRSDYTMRIAALNPESTQDAIVTSAVLGLDLTEGKNQAWLLPRSVDNSTRIVLQVGYKGVEAIHQRLGVIDRLSVRIVRQADAFEWSGDESEKPTHTADWFAPEAKRGPIVGAFAITYYPDGSTQTVVKGIDEIYEKHRNTSDSWKSYQRRLAKGESPHPPPWESFPAEMVAKTMAYVARKQWPANIRNAEVAGAIIDRLNEVDFADYESLREGYTEEQLAEFNRLIEEGFGLPLYLFYLYVGDEVYSNLYNSAPKGEKMRLKERAKRLEDEGVNILHLLRSHLEDGSDMAALEIVQELTDPYRKLLERVLEPDLYAKVLVLLKETGDS